MSRNTYFAMNAPPAFRNIQIAVAATFCLAGWPMHALEPQFPAECPRRGTLEVLEHPAAWADQCFAALNGRMPRLDHVGETSSAMRDINLDGADERLEIRGVGNSAKSIYVFEVIQAGYVYLGLLEAHPSFTVAPDSEGTPTISYVHRAGVGDVTVKRIQYRDGTFAEVSSEQARRSD